MTIYLDIDGVMVPAKSWSPPPILSDGFPAFSPQACTALNAVLHPEDVVILTTSHKGNYSLVEWKSIFALRGINLNHLQTLPPTQHPITRKEELMAWFNHVPQHQAFVIIDDDYSLHDLPEMYKQHWVATSSTIGLNKQHVQTIQTIRNRILLPS